MHCNFLILPKFSGKSDYLQSSHKHKILIPFIKTKQNKNPPKIINKQNNKTNLYKKNPKQNRNNIKA